MFNILGEIGFKDRSHSSIYDCRSGEGENAMKHITLRAYVPGVVG